MDGVGIISASFALQSLRNSGYKSTALAVAELVDNSIDAGATDVDVINLSEEEKRYNDFKNKVEHELYEHFNHLKIENDLSKEGQELEEKIWLI